MPDLRIRDLSKFFNQVIAVNHISLDVYDGEMLTLLGPSGCGKTTTLRLIAGLETPDTGEVLLGEIDPATKGREVTKTYGVRLVLVHARTLHADGGETLTSLRERVTASPEEFDPDDRAEPPASGSDDDDDGQWELQISHKAQMGPGDIIKAAASGTISADHNRLGGV